MQILYPGHYYERQLIDYHAFITINKNFPHWVFVFPPTLSMAHLAQCLTTTACPGAILTGGMKWTRYAGWSCLQRWNWVTGSMGHLSRPGHQVIILTRCETRFFQFLKKTPKMHNVHLKCWNDKSHRQAMGQNFIITRVLNKILKRVMEQ